MCTVLTTFQPKKVYLGLAESDFEMQNVWKIKKTKLETPMFFMPPRKVSHTHVSKLK